MIWWSTNPIVKSSTQPAKLIPNCGVPRVLTGCLFSGDSDMLTAMQNALRNTWKVFLYLSRHTLRSHFGTISRLLWIKLLRDGVGGMRYVTLKILINTFQLLVRCQRAGLRRVVLTQFGFHTSLIISWDWKILLFIILGNVYFKTHL